MKQILVPIDYSSYSNNAVGYAIGIANKINASIHLFHGLEMPELIPMAGIMMWPTENFSETKQDSDEDLQRYVEKLKKNHELLPNITCSSETGSVTQIISRLTSEQHFDLVVMGLAGAGKIDRFFMGSNSKAVIDHCTVPVLLIPKETAYQPIKKIGFATDLHKSDVNSIYILTRLFVPFNPEILLVHVSNKASDFHDPTTPANLFLNRVTCTMNYSKIYYRHIKASNVEEGLKWVSENGNINILVMVHREASFFAKIMDNSHTQKIATATHLPLLVMPDTQPHASHVPPY